MISAFRTERSGIVNAFVIKASQKLNKGLPIEKINLKSGIKVYHTSDSSIIVYGYEIIGEKILRIAGFIGAAIIFLIAGFKWYMLFPLFFLFLPEITSLIAYWLIYKGLRRQDYKGKIKYIFYNEALEEVVFNVSN